MKKNVSLIVALMTGILTWIVLTGCQMDIEIPQEQEQEQEQEHKHTYSEKWTSNEEYHWHVADCEHKEEISEKDVHIWDAGKVTTEPTETAEGEKTYKCTVCNKTKTEVLAKLSHQHAYKEEWESDATQHWHVCKGEDCKEKGSLENHIWGGGVCSVCGLEKEIKGTQPEEYKPVVKYPNDINPTVSSTASVSQDFIFNTNTIGFTTITIRRSEWNKILDYYDFFYKNENSVIAESYEYEKDGRKWKLNTVGLRIRGNTSRIRPQGKDQATDASGHTQWNVSWNQDYYNYAATCSDDVYRQSHFKVDFEPLDDDDRKLSDCMKGVALKRSDSFFSKEIFCYDMFRKMGIWTAPRASHTKVTLKIVEDIGSDNSIIKDLTGCEIMELNYGVYEMFEEVNKQSLKGRMKKKENNTAASAWANNDGDLWKCSGGDLTASTNTYDRFGCEKIKILNTDKDKSQWQAVWESPCYDLKTNKSSINQARINFQTFLTELNNLSNINFSTPAGIAARKQFYEKWFDVDFFIRTYAVNILLGMDDDYWGNANNYYLYFDNAKGGTGKCYLIPFDYDNTLGGSINRNKTILNPLEWGYKEENGVVFKQDRPLLDRLLEVPEYLEKMKATLLEVSSQDSTSPWNKNKCQNTWVLWHLNVGPYVHTKDVDVSYGKGSVEINENVNANWGFSLLAANDKGLNYYEKVSENFNKWLTKPSKEIIFDLNGGSVFGSTENVVRTYNGSNSMFNAILGETPVRNCYKLLGWTKTKDGTEILQSYDYNDENNLTVYAKWEEIPTIATINKREDRATIVPDDISIRVEAKSDGLHITKRVTSVFNHVNICVTDDTAGIALIPLDNIDSDGNNVRTEEFLYAFVENDHVYTLKFEMMDNNWQQYHTVECTVRAVGGQGNVYISCDGYTYDKSTKTMKLINFQKYVNNFEKLASDPRVNNGNYRIGMFDTKMWADGEHARWDYRWNLISSNELKFYEYNGENNSFGNEATWFDNKEKNFIYLGYEFDYDGVHYRKSLVEGQIWPK